jgi:hypothetical protein
VNTVLTHHGHKRTDYRSHSSYSQTRERDTLCRYKRMSLYRGVDKSLARPTSPYILFDGYNISFDASLVTYINSTNIPPIMIINRIYENQNLLSL